MHRNFIAAVQLARLCVFNEFVSSAAHRHGGVSSVTAKASACTEIRDVAFTDTTDSLDLKIFGGFPGRYDTDASSTDGRFCVFVCCWNYCHYFPTGKNSCEFPLGPESLRKCWYVTQRDVNVGMMVRNFYQSLVL